MKWLTVLSTIQLIATLSLLYVVFSLVHEQKIQRTEIRTMLETNSANEKTAQTLVTLDASIENALRQILREQLVTFEHTHTSEQNSSRQQPDRKNLPAKATAAQVEAIENDLEYYFSVGAISENEMSSLQAQIARLDKDNRTLMLRKLVKAMNDGRIKGHL